MLKTILIASLLSAPVYIKKDFDNVELVKVVDGDTIKVKLNRGESKEVNIRLSCSDAPESVFQFNKSQYYKNVNIGLKAKEYTQKILLLKRIDLKCDGTKSYGRLNCYVYANDVNVNEKLIIDGYAYTNEKYCSNNEIVLQERAMLKKRGLWAFGEWQEPCEFRGSCIDDN